MKKLLLLLALTTALPTAAVAQATDEGPEQISFLKSERIGRQDAVTRSAGREGVTATLQYVQLPDMKKPRHGHQTFVNNGYLLVVGGETTGGILTSTAEKIDFTSSDSKWEPLDLQKPHYGAFAVKRRHSNGSAITTTATTQYVIGGGLANVGGLESITATDVPYHFLGKIISFANGPKLSTPRAFAKGIYVKGKTYISGNYYGDDSTMEVLEEGVTGFNPVGKTSPHMKPYMFADSLGRVMVTSAYNNYGEVAEFYTDDNGNQMLIGDLYDPSTGQTRRIGLIDFTPKNLPMLLPDDAKSEDYRVTYDNGSHRHFILTCSIDGDYMLHNLNMEDLMLGFFDDFEIPSKDKATGLVITWRGSVIANQNRKEVYLIGTSGPVNNQTLHIISFNYRTLDWTIASASGFKYNMLTASWTLLKDGRLASTGGDANNGDIQATVYLFNPPIAGTTQVAEPDNNDEGGEGLCVVVENTNGQKVRYLLEEDPRFYLKGETVTVVTSELTIDYQTDNIARVYLEDYTSTDIDVNELPTLKEGSMSIEAGRIVITGLESGETATVYQLSGTPVTTAKADQEGRIVISIDGTPGKVSIIKTKHQSFKIIRK